jgi:hypothetical protein
MTRAYALAALLLAGCGQAESLSGATSADLAPYPAAEAGSTYRLPGPPIGMLEIDGVAGAPEKVEIVAAYAYFLEWPEATNLEPAMRLSHIDLLLDANDDRGCGCEGAPSKKGGKLQRVELRSKGGDALHWETDIALGDEVDLLLHGLPPSEFAFDRWGVVLSIGRERVRGFVRYDDARRHVHGRFRAEVCPPPAW